MGGHPVEPAALETICHGAFLCGAQRRGQRPEGEQREPLVRCTAELGCLFDRLVITDQLEDITLWVVDVQGPPTTPTVFSRGDVNSQLLQASQFGVKVILVDFERETSV